MFWFPISNHLNWKKTSCLLTYKCKKKFWEELSTYFPSIQYRPHRKQCLQQFFIAVWTCLPSHCLAMIGDTQTDPQTLLWYNMDCIENNASNNSSIVACIRHHGNMSTKPLPNNSREHTHTGTQTHERDL
jgi:hypothetical protein